MHVGLAFTGAIPALIAMWYVDRLDAKRPEPRSVLRLVALAGALSTIPCVGAELVLGEIGTDLGFYPGTYAAAFYTGFIVAALTEELAKVGCVYWLVWKRPEFDERLDGIVYGTRAGLGFALVENVLYLAQAADFESFAWVFVARAVLAVPGHAIWGGLMGYYAARRRFDGTGPGLLGGLALAVFLHGTYDVAIFVSPLVAVTHGETVGYSLLAIPILVIIGGGVALRRLARKALADDDRHEEARRLAYAQQGMPGHHGPQGHYGQYGHYGQHVAPGYEQPPQPGYPQQPHPGYPQQPHPGYPQQPQQPSSPNQPTGEPGQPPWPPSGHRPPGGDGSDGSPR